MGFTDALQRERMIVVAVDRASGRVRVRGEAEVCSDVACSDQTLVVTDDGVTPDLEALNPGDIVRVEGGPEAARRIVVVRRVWDELSSPEW
jgi:hypothetical protein